MQQALYHPVKRLLSIDKELHALRMLIALFYLVCEYVHGNRHDLAIFNKVLSK